MSWPCSARPGTRSGRETAPSAITRWSPSSRPLVVSAARAAGSIERISSSTTRTPRSPSSARALLPSAIEPCPTSAHSLRRPIVNSGLRSTSTTSCSSPSRRFSSTEAAMPPKPPPRIERPVVTRRDARVRRLRPRSARTRRRTACTCDIRSLNSPCAFQPWIASRLSHGMKLTKRSGARRSRTITGVAAGARQARGPARELGPRFEELRLPDRRTAATILSSRRRRRSCAEYESPRPQPQALRHRTGRGRARAGAARCAGSCRSASSAGRARTRSAAGRRRPRAARGRTA